MSGVLGVSRVDLIGALGEKEEGGEKKKVRRV